MGEVLAPPNRLHQLGAAAIFQQALNCPIITVPKLFLFSSCSHL